MIRLTVIKPNAKKVLFTRFADAARQGLEDAADGALKDFQSTTKTWKHDVTFEKKARKDGYDIGPTGGATEIYGYVDQGTRAHRIIARRAKRLRFGVGGSPKTRPGAIGSGSGSAGKGAVFARAVNHPGSKARGFSKLIRAKWAAQTKRLIEQRIREAM